jgi:outer membrane lipoprotein carrier protein
MNTSISRRALLSLMVSVFLSGAGASVWAGDAVDRLIEGMLATQSMSAEFTQTTSAGRSGRLRTTSGVFWILRPGQVRWEVRRPSLQVQIINSREFWSYDADLAQASMRPRDSAQLAGVAGLLLNGQTLDRDALMARYAFNDLGNRQGLAWVEVVPRQPEPGLERMRIGIDAQSVPLRFDIVDSLGQVSQIELQKVQKNVVIDPRVFEFTPPAGVSVLRSF